MTRFLIALITLMVSLTATAQTAPVEGSNCDPEVAAAQVRTYQAWRTMSDTTTMTQITQQGRRYNLQCLIQIPGFNFPWPGQGFLQALLDQLLQQLLSRVCNALQMSITAVEAPLKDVLSQPLQCAIV